MPTFSDLNFICASSESGAVVPYVNAAPSFSVTSRKWRTNLMSSPSRVTRTRLAVDFNTRQHSLNTTRTIVYNRINSTKSPASDAGNVREPRLMSLSQDSARSRVRVDQCSQSGGGASIGVLT